MSEETPPSAPLSYAQPVRNDLYEIAIRQRAIMYCILGQIACWILLAIVPGPIKIIFALGWIAVSIVGMVFVFMLAIKLYNIAVGIVFGIGTLVPLIGLLILLIVNGKATNILRAHGVKVGLMGANPSQIPRTARY